MGTKLLLLLNKVPPAKTSPVSATLTQPAVKLSGKRTSQPGRARPSTTCRSSTPAKTFHKCEKLITTRKGGLLMSHRRMMISFFRFVDEEFKNQFLFHDSQPVRIVDHRNLTPQISPNCSGDQSSKIFW